MDTSHRYLDYLCRTCMNEVETSTAGCYNKPRREWKSIFDKIKEYDSLQIFELIVNTVPQIKIRLMDELPKKICCKCLQQLLTARRFQQMCVQSEENMRAMVSKKRADIEISMIEAAMEVEKGSNDKDSYPLKNFHRSTLQNLQNLTIQEPLLEESELINDLEVSPSSDTDHLQNINQLLEQGELSEFIKNEPIETDAPNIEFSDAVTMHPTISVKSVTLPIESEEQQVTVNSSSQHNCHLCNTSFENAEDLKKHLKNHKIYGEPVQKGARRSHRVHKENWVQNQSLVRDDKSNRKIFKMRLKLEHLADEKKIITKQHSCEVCNKSFRTSFALRIHVRKHKSKEQNDAKSFSRERRSNRQRSSDVEDKTYKRKTKRAKQQSCDVCGKNFRKQSDLKRHRLIHSDEKPHKCDFCERRFTRIEHLHDHTRIHTGEKPFKCKHCKRSFARRSVMVRHLSIHLGDNIFRCKLCPLAFSAASGLRLHFATHKNDDSETRAKNMKALKEVETKLELKLSKKQTYENIFAFKSNMDSSQRTEVSLEYMRCCRSCLSVASQDELNDYIDLMESFTLSQSDVTSTILEAFNKYAQLQIKPDDFDTRNVVAFLTSAKCEHHLNNTTLLEQLVTNLPPGKQYEWTRHAVNIKSYPTIKEFSQWLSDLARVVCLNPQSTIATRSQQPPPHLQSSRRLMLGGSERQQEHTASLKCYVCDGAHSISDCQNFHQSMSARDRWEKVKTLQLCFSCLRKEHNTSNCRSKKPCGVNACRRYHHKSLHEAPISNSTPPTIQNSGAPQPLLNCREAMYKNSQFFKYVPVSSFRPNGKVDTYAMIDEGSAISLLEDSVATKLGLKGRKQPLTLQCKAEYSHLKILSLEDYHQPKPSLLLGLDNTYLSVPSTTVQANSRSPVAINTKLGWIAYGSTRAPTTMPVVLHIREKHSLSSLHEMVTEYLAADNFGVQSESTKLLESEDNEQARHMLEDNTRRIGKRFESGLLWKCVPPALPNSYAMAYSRLLGIENKMCLDKEFATRYREEIAKYIRNGYARPLSKDEVVQSPHKPGKMKIVFDAAANCTLLKGPEQAKPLLDILFKFREGAVAVAADIRDMFWHVVKAGDGMGVSGCKNFSASDIDGSRNRNNQYNCYSFAITCNANDHLENMEHCNDLQSEFGEFIKNEPIEIEHNSENGYDNSMHSTVSVKSELLTIECEERQISRTSSKTRRKCSLACNVCGKMCGTQSTLAKHLKIYHSTQNSHDQLILKKHSCNVCDKGFIDSSALKRHMRTHTGERPFSCPECGRSFAALSNLNRHRLGHGGDKPFRCPYCPQRFRCSESLSTHKISHERFERQPCDICGKSIRKSQLNKHQLIHCNEKPHKCEFCEWRFPYIANLRRHMRTHTGEKPFKCKYCERPFASQSVMVQHFRIHLGDDVYRCELCPSAFPLASELRLHINMHENDDPETREQNMKALKEEDAKLKSKIKTQQLLPQSSLDLEIQATGNRKTRDKSYQCPYCPQRFPSKVNVTKHKKMHEVTKRQTSVICDQSIRESDLKKSQLARFDEKPHKCDFCEWRFRQINHLRRHMRSHTGEKPYKCKYCERAFASKSEVMQHLRRHLGDNIYRCTFCPLAFPLASKLRLHITSHENEDPDTRERNVKALKDEEMKLEQTLSKRDTQQPSSEESQNVNSDKGNKMDTRDQYLDCLCRTCMNEVDVFSYGGSAKSQQWQSVFDTIEVCGALQIAELLSSTVPQILEVQLSDELPKKICFKCLHQLIASYRFQQMCVHSDEQIRELVSEKRKDLEMSMMKAAVKMETNYADSYPMENFNASTFRSLPHPSMREPFTVTEQVCKFESVQSNAPYHLHMMDEFVESSQNDLSSLIKNEPIEDDDPNIGCSDNNTMHSTISVKGEILAIDSEEPEKSLTIYSSSQHNCHLCTKSFKELRYLKKHLKRHKAKEGERPYSCSECGKSFLTQCILKRHRLLHGEDKPYECPYCPLRFSSNTNIARHKTIHEGVKREDCDICGKSIRKSDLNKHKLIHSGEKPHKCDFCEKRFTHIKGLRGHMRTHTGEKPYKCNYCDRAFSSRTVQIQHLRTHLGENVYRCEFCPLGFPLAAELRLHFTTHKNDDPETRERNMKALKEEEAKLKWKLSIEKGRQKSELE
ncbi:uncharacterized protein [Eurosta solidaginis]|uniref:uncharacterized protein n=1 Tax=Eurosta solidaginis TaxID=178769 RepID=UPI003530CB69